MCDRPADESRKESSGEPQIEVTPEMIAAGAAALSEIGDASTAYLAEAAFRAMIALARFPCRGKDS